MSATKPAILATTPGQAATAILSQTGAIGGDTSITTTGVGGAGAALTITCGTGGVAASANTAATGGIGGALSVGVSGNIAGWIDKNAVTIIAISGGAQGFWVTFSKPLVITSGTPIRLWFEHHAAAAGNLNGTIMGYEI